MDDPRRFSELLGGALLLGGCLLVVLLLVTVWIPIMWAIHLDNTRWLYAHGDRSRLVRATLWVVDTFPRLKP
jgi:hypothetical protein